MSTYLSRTTVGEALIGDEEGYVPLSAADPTLSNEIDALGAGTIPDPGDASARRIPESALSLGIPVSRPGALWGIGLNYAEHAADLDEDRPEEPASFLQPPATAVGPGGPIRLPPVDVTRRVTAEAELGVVIGRTCRDVSPERAADAIGGFLALIDVTAEDVLQRNPRFLTRSKSFDAFLVLGPRIYVPEPGAEIDDWSVRTIVDGTTVAENTVANMRFSPLELVASLSRSTTLRPGDVIATGTPGAGRIEPGALVRAEIDRVGSAEAAVVR